MIILWLNVEEYNFNTLKHKIKRDSTSLLCEASLKFKVHSAVSAVHADSREQHKPRKRESQISINNDDLLVKLTFSYI